MITAGCLNNDEIFFTYNIFLMSLPYNSDNICLEPNTPVYLEEFGSPIKIAYRHEEKIRAPLLCLAAFLEKRQIGVGQLWQFNDASLFPLNGQLDFLE